MQGSGGIRLANHVCYSIFITSQGQFMVTGCEPTSVRFTGLVINSSAVEGSYDDPSVIATMLIFGRLYH